MSDGLSVAEQSARWRRILVDAGVPALVADIAGALGAADGPARDQLLRAAHYFDFTLGDADRAAILAHLRYAGGASSADAAPRLQALREEVEALRRAAALHRGGPAAQPGESEEDAQRRRLRAEIRTLTASARSAEDSIERLRACMNLIG
ncbi:hypothetical protein [Azospirillum sp. B506]|uniref:hypothetical protein n=1 Tax=Azospirillum sp. B506 TaxID=137721 RepID=UPI0003489EA1|nr:hypothetical protein [Azospirillum sp. B506]